MKKSNGEKIFNFINIVFMFLLCLVMVYPYINSLAVSFNDSKDTMLGGITFYPRIFSADSYKVVLKDPIVIRAFLISISRSIAGTLIALIVTSGAAYAITKKRLPGRKMILMFLTIPMFISGGLIPMFILFRYIHFLNNFLVYIIPGAFSIYNMHVIRTYFNTIPSSLEESALIDGANETIIFFKVMLPLSKPVLATVTLWVIVGNWNDWLTTLYFIQNQNLYPLQYVLMKLIRESEMLQKMIAESVMKGLSISRTPSVTPQSIQAATLIVATLPVVISYPFLQKYFVKGVMIGSVKE